MPPHTSPKNSIDSSKYTYVHGNKRRRPREQGKRGTMDQGARETILGYFLSIPQSVQWERVHSFRVTALGICIKNVHMAMVALRKSKGNLKWPLAMKHNGAPHNPPNIPPTLMWFMGYIKEWFPRKFILSHPAWKVLEMIGGDSTIPISIRGFLFFICKRQQKRFYSFGRLPRSSSTPFHKKQKPTVWEEII